MIKNSLQLCADRFITEKAIHPESLCRTNISGTITGDSYMKKIPLTQGKFALVDDEDFEKVSQFKWNAYQNGNSYYACRCQKQTRKTIYIHRAIVNCPKGLVIDHINHNGLDNQKNNLRICTHGENLRNQFPQKGRSSQYKGVHLKKTQYKRKINTYWVAQIQHRGKKLHLGIFPTEIEAAEAYNKKAKKLFGDFFYLNDIKESEEKNGRIKR